MHQFSGFIDLRQISSSARSSIYRAKRESDAKHVVIKVLNEEYPTRIQLAKYKHEFNITQSLAGTPGVIEFYQLLKAGNSLAIVMNDSNGDALSNITERHKLDLEDALSVMTGFTKALVAIHKKGVIHKDIKPHNIVWNEKENSIEIIDFGISTTLAREKLNVENPDALEGTLAYMSPEQTGRMNRSVTYSSDLYSSGVVFFYLLTGRPPFESNDPMELVHSHIAKRPPFATDVDPYIPQVVARIVDKLLSKNEEDRYLSASGLLYDLEKCKKNLTWQNTIEDFELGEMDYSDRFHIPQKLYGRENEIATLEQAFARVAAAGSEMAFVSGFSGIGKSALIKEIQKSIIGKRSYFIDGKFDQYERDVPYSSLIAACRELVRQILTESSERVAHWGVQLKNVLGDNGKVITDVLPELQHIMGIQPEVPELGPQENRNRFNHYFTRFISVFSSQEHPLVLFLDDLQWADSASLEMIERLVATHEIPLFFIGAYRDNEVNAASPLMTMINQLRKRGDINISDIHLDALSLSATTQIIADTLDVSTDTTHELVALIHQKTAGNPFFINQLLKNIYDKGLISFNHQQHSWQWDIQGIRTLDVSDNVVDLMVKEIESLAPEAQNVLKFASCLGNRFSLSHLAYLLDVDCETLAEHIWPVLQSGLVMPLDKNYKFLNTRDTVSSGSQRDKNADTTFKFLHDRVQQAANSLLDEQSNKQAHLKIGFMLLEQFDDSGINEHIFDITNHLNQASTLVDDLAKRIKLAELNLMAATKAKNSNAYDYALEQVKFGLALLGEGMWTEHHEVMFGLSLLHAQCLYLVGQYENAEKAFDLPIEKAVTPLQNVEAAEAKIHFYADIGEFEKAYLSGRVALKRFNVSVPPSFIPPLLIKDLIKTKIKLGRRKPQDLINLPACEDENAYYAMRLISAMLKSAYQIRPELCVHNAIIAVGLSLKYGDMKDNAVAYLVFGSIFLGSVLGDKQAGYEYGKLAIAMLDKHRNRRLLSEVLFVFGYFANSYTEHARQSEKIHRRSYEIGLEVGDLFHVACSACTIVETQFLRGVAIDEVQEEAQKFYRFMQQIENRESAGAILSVMRAIRNLQGKTTAKDSFNGDGFAEAPFVEEINQYTSLHFSHFYFVNKMRTLLVWGEIEQAYAMAKASEKFLKYSIGMLHTAEHYFLSALIHLQVLRRNIAVSKKPAKSVCVKSIKKLSQWAKRCPENYQHKVLLLEAELAFLEGKNWLAADKYSQAMHAATQAEYNNDIALTADLAAQFYTHYQNEMLARFYAKEARYAYTKWGSAPKAAQLEQLYQLQQYANDSSTMTVTDSRTLAQETSITGSTTNHLQFDLGTAIKATQALSSEIIVAKLLEKFMTLMFENAGAQRGFLLKPVKDSYLVKAYGEADEGEITTEAYPLDADTQQLAFSIVQYVTRTKENVVCQDASVDSRFAQNGYIAEHHTKSLLCAPIMQKGTLAYIIYLENNLAPGAFNSQRLEMVRMLSAQIAISLDNAELYENVTSLSEAYERFVPKQFLNLLEKDSIVDVKLGDYAEKEITTLFSDIRAFTSLSESMTPEENFHFINSYLTRMEPVIHKYNGFIDKYIGDAIMALFPTSAEDALNAAINMRIVLQKYNEHRAKKNYKPIDIGLGLNTGKSMLGTVGGKQRMDGTVISDAVNIASRVEGMTKIYGAHILATDETLNRITTKSNYLTRFVDKVAAKGKTKPVMIYEIFDGDEEIAKEGKQKTLLPFHEAIRQYYLLKFDEAQQGFEECLRIYPDDIAARLYLDRCKAMKLQHPGENWDGITRLQTK